MAKTVCLLKNRGKKCLVFWNGRFFLFGKYFKICLHYSKRSSKLMGCVGRKLLLNVKCVIQTDKHLIKGFCQLRNFIMAFWNINGNRKILCLNIRNFLLRLRSGARLLRVRNQVDRLLIKITTMVTARLLIMKSCFVWASWSLICGNSIDGSTWNVIGEESFWSIWIA